MGDGGCAKAAYSTTVGATIQVQSRRATLTQPLPQRPRVFWKDMYDLGLLCGLLGGHLNPLGCMEEWDMDSKSLSSNHSTFSDQLCEETCFCLGSAIN